MPDQSPQIKLTNNLNSTEVRVNLKTACLIPLSGPNRYQLLFSPGRDNARLLKSSMEMENSLIYVKWVVSCLIF